MKTVTQHITTKKCKSLTKSNLHIFTIIIIPKPLCGFEKSKLNHTLIRWKWCDTNTICAKPDQITNSINWWVI